MSLPRLYDLFHMGALAIIGLLVILSIVFVYIFAKIFKVRFRSRLASKIKTKIDIYDLSGRKLPRSAPLSALLPIDKKLLFKF